MRKIISIFFTAILIVSCHRKTAPAAPPPPPSPVIKQNASKQVEKPRPIPNVIIVNDQAATKTPEGRYYYDLNGQRYWKNFRTGKYYIYRKGINADPDFTPPAKKD